MVKTCVTKGKEKRNVVSKKFDLNWCQTYLKLMKSGSSSECLTKVGENGGILSIFMGSRTDLKFFWVMVCK